MTATKLKALQELLDINNPKIKALQLKKLKKQLIYVYDNSPYYKAKFKAAGVNPHQLQSLKEFEKYPTFDKYEERESQAQSLAKYNHPLGLHLTCDIKAVNRMSASSGTTGTPSFQGHTAFDRSIMFKNFARMAQMTGLKKGDKVLMAGVMSMWVAGIPTIDCLQNFGANVIPIGGLVGAAKVVEMIGLTYPDALVCTPSFARLLIKKAQTEMNVDLTNKGVKSISVYGEPGGSIPEIAKEISDGFGGADVFDMSGGTGCLNPIFTSCKAHAGMHFIAPDHAYMELYDRSTKTVLPMVHGAEGELVYTALERECGPLIRFMDGDNVRINLTPCSCGLPGIRISILGRVDDMLLIKGVNVFPSAIRDVILGFKGEVTGNVRIVKNSTSPVIEPPLQVKVECVGNPTVTAKADLKSRLEAIIQRKLRFKAVITLFEEGTLKMEYGATGKMKLIEMV